MIDRRRFLRSALAAAGGLASAGRILPSGLFTQDGADANALPTLPDPQDSGIEHVVVLMMENRSFDHLLGWMPGTDGRQAGLSYLDPSGMKHKTYPLAPDFTGCPHADPDHSYDGARIEYAGGKMDGFLKDTSNDVFCIGYYRGMDQPFYSRFARSFTTLARYFPSILGPTFPNRMFQHAAQTDRLSNTFTPSTLPTIWDELAIAGISARYYFNNLPFLGLWGPKYIPISAPYTQFVSDAGNGTLPAVSFVDPRFTVLDDGTGNDDHPHADIRSGEAFMAQTFYAASHGPAWKNTVFVLNWDEWGGFFEHIPPPRATAPNNIDPDPVNGKALLGFRVPTIVASPFSRGNPAKPRVNSLVFDHTSVLKLIEWRWNLPALTARDACTDVQNLAYALDFQNANTTVPKLPQPVAPPPMPCLPVSRPQAAGSGFRGLLNSGLLQGWALPPWLGS
jgi:phospholipase C